VLVRGLEKDSSRVRQTLIASQVRALESWACAVCMWESRVQVAGRDLMQALDRALQGR
jgi:hypothetical protein